MDSIGPRDVGSLADEIEKMRSREEKRFAAELLEAPFFKKIIAVLEQFQSLVQAEPDEEKKGDMLERFQSLFLISGMFYQETTQNFNQERASIQHAARAAFDGTFSPDTFASELAQSVETKFIGMHPYDVASQSSEDDVFADLESLVVETSLDPSTGNPCITFHFNVASKSDMEMLATLGKDVETVKEIIRTNSQYLNATIHMKSWVLMRNNDRVLKKMLGNKAVEAMSFHPPPDPEQVMRVVKDPSSPDEEMFVGMLSFGISFNKTVSRDWIVDATLPEVGEIEIPARDFVST